MECYDTLIISYVLYGTDYYTWTMVSPPGASLNVIFAGSASGHVDGNIRDFRICTDGANYPTAFVYSTWTEQWGPWGSYDSTRVMFARSSELDVSSWEIVPDRLAYSGSGGSNNIYYDYTRIAHGIGSNILIVAHLHPNAYPGTFDDNIRGWLSTTYGTSWGSEMQITPIDNGIDEYQPSIAGSHTDSNWVCLNTFSDISNTYTRIENNYSLDNCANWTDVAWVSPNDNFYPDVWVDDNSTAFFGAFRKDLSSTEEVRYKQGDINNPFTWTNSLRVNDDAELSNSYGPSVAYNYATGNAIMAWTNFAGSIYSIWFDNQSWSVRVEEENPSDVGNSSDIMYIISNPSYRDISLIYTITVPGNVRITLRDVSGRLVHEYINVYRASGIYDLNLTPEISTGVYYINIKSPEGSQTKQVVFIK